MSPEQATGDRTVGLAYESDETGRNQIYVRPFPDVDAAKWTVIGERRDHAALVTGWGCDLLRDETLFPLGLEFLIPQSGNYTVYDITPDDERFLMRRRRPTSMP